MAINYTVSYTFSPNTTISSSQVNTNFSDNANTWNGLEAGTKSISQIKVDADPTLALQLATKQYVDHYSTWRRPVLQYASATTVTVESGLDGTSGNIPILFPDGTIRTETSTTRTTFNITRNAVLTTSGAQSGLRTSLSEATNTWYALYAVKVTDSSSQWCTVGDTVLPVQSSFSTLNSNFGTSGWVYLGLIRNGDNSGATGDIISFIQSGNETVFRTQNSGSTMGLLLASTTASSLTYTYAAGTGTTDIPAVISIAAYQALDTGTDGAVQFRNSGNSIDFAQNYGGSDAVEIITRQAASLGLRINGDNVPKAISLQGFRDGVLGVGSNPLL